MVKIKRQGCDLIVDYGENHGLPMQIWTHYIPSCGPEWVAYMVENIRLKLGLQRGAVELLTVGELVQNALLGTGES